MRRTQLYLEDSVWAALHERARSDRTTISELVRVAVREHYFGKLDQRKNAMLAFVGSRTSGASETDSTELVRDLRRGNRLEGLQSK